MDDVKAPSLRNLNFPRPIDLSSGSATVSVSAIAFDELTGSGVDHAVVYFDRMVGFSTGAGFNFHIGGIYGGADTFTDDTPLTASTNFILTDATAAGIYNIHHVVVEDVVGNKASYSALQLKALGISTTMIVTGNTADDTIAPQLLELDLPTTVDLSAGPRTVSVSAYAKDNTFGSGIYDITVFFDREITLSHGTASGFQIGNLSETSRDKDTFVDDTPWTASTSLTITDATAPGVYNISKVAIRDLAGNQVIYNTDELKEMGINTSLTVTGSVADPVAPTLLKLNLPTVVDLTAGTQTVAISGEATDNAGGSGVNWLTVIFDNDLVFNYGAGSSVWIGGPKYAWTDNFNDSTPNKASDTFTLSTKTTPGLYTIREVWVDDFTGNRAAYTTEQLKALGINTTLTVRDKSSLPATASLAPTVNEQGVTLSLASADWSPSGSNTVALTLKYDANAVHYDSLSIVNGASSILSSSVSETNGVGKLTIYGAFSTSADAQTAMQLLLKPISATGTLSYSLDSFAVNGKPQTLGSSASGNLYHGSSGADLIAHAEGLSHIDSGTGIDVAAFSNNANAYTILKTADGYTVGSNRGDLTTLTHVERLRFDDATLSIDGDGADGQIYRLYQAAFGRQPDKPGIGYWMAQMDRGTSLGQAANAFVTSKEFSDLYGADTGSQAFLTALYQNVLHRAPDAAGYNYWIDVLGHADRASVLVAFSESSENVAQVVGAIEHGFAYTPWA
ncbi:DUF4214 domain-containing protein [Duganella sp. BuS-21]|uniref:DUF4214 domain-containing protein n=1 Tax=Duganella sp. BuS-21 TaxID=2943848 RepID=UPI0035A69EF7